MKQPAHFKPVVNIRNGISYNTASEPSMRYVFVWLFNNKYYIREINHSHPFSPNPSQADITFAKQVREIYSKKRVSAPSLNIYHVEGGNYIPF